MAATVTITLEEFKGLEDKINRLEEGLKKVSKDKKSVIIEQGRSTLGREYLTGSEAVLAITKELKYFVESRESLIEKNLSLKIQLEEAQSAYRSLKRELSHMTVSEFRKWRKENK